MSGVSPSQFFPASRFSTLHLHQDMIFFCYRWWLVLQHKTTSKDADVWHTSTDIHSLKPPYWWLFGDGSGSPVRYTTGVEASVTCTLQHAWGNQQLLVSHSNTTKLLIYWGSLQGIWSAPNCLCAATYLVFRSHCTSLWSVSKLSLRPPIVQKIDKTSLAASIVVRTTTVTGYSVHTIQPKQITHRVEVHHILLSLYWFPCIWLNLVAQLLCGSND